jgi:molybdopterin-guanine dinucleotide biosynthesis protein A
MTGQQPIVAVLAGGLGERLGGAGKACVALSGRPLICYPLQAASDAGLEAVVVAKPSTTLPPLAARVLREPQEPRHPLCGVLTALAFVAAERPLAPALVALACDMPFLTAPLLTWIAGLDGAVMAQVDGRPQPLLSRWPVARLDALERAPAERRSLSAVLAGLAPRIVDERDLARFGDARRLSFNVNDADDLRAARRWLPAR